ncbi:MAG: CoA transferase [Chloroflexota bacterium]|nr:CoA transferase [Chloroflexota bacterium]
MTDGALPGLRIIDLCWVMAGPQATRILADFGAEVIKVESRARPDPGRVVFGPWVGEPGIDNNGYFNNFNRNKRSISLNMSHPEGREIFGRLVAISDGVVENYSASVMRNWGFDYEGLCRHRPDIVYVSMAGLGHSGPYEAYQTFGPTVQALSGLTHLSGSPDMQPAGWGYSYMDHTGGYMAAIAMLTALFHRRRTGRGQYIDLAQVEAAITLTGTAILDYTVNARSSERHGNRAAYLPMAPHGVYRCAPADDDGVGDDDWLAIAVEDDAQWRSLARAIGRPDMLEDPRFASLDARLAHHDDLDAAIGAWTRPRPAKDAMQALQAAGVPAGRVQRSRELYDDDPQLAHRGLFPKVDHPVVGEHRVDGMPAQFSRTPASFRQGGPLLGDSNAYVFGELLGIAEDERAHLEEAQVLW